MRRWPILPDELAAAWTFFGDPHVSAGKKHCSNVIKLVKKFVVTCFLWKGASTEFSSLCHKLPKLSTKRKVALKENVVDGLPMSHGQSWWCRRPTGEDASAVRIAEQIQENNLKEARS